MSSAQKRGMIVAAMVFVVVFITKLALDTAKGREIDFTDALLYSSIVAIGLGLFQAYRGTSYA